jgi:uncharacterized protein (TIGR03083 family)
MAVSADEHDVNELEALLALDALDEGEQLDAELALGPRASRLADVTAALAETAISEPPVALRAATLGSAVAARPAGTSIDGVEPRTPLEAYAHFVDDLASLLGDLDAVEWSAPAHEAYGSVRDLVAHLCRVEEITLGWLGAREPIAAADHIEATRSTIAALASLAPGAVAGRWHELAQQVVAEARVVDHARPVVAHDIPTDVDGVLVLRSFELWSHADDIRRATGRAVPAPDPAAMALLSQRLMAVVALALLFRGAELPRGSARFVLTGPGGGTYDVDLGEGSAETATIVADVVDLCRVAARRLSVDDLDWALDGDERIATVLLANVDAFARD